MRWLRQLCSALVRRLSTPPAANEGKCGAVALHFVYKRLGLRTSLREIWSHVKATNLEPSPGETFSSGHLMCLDAIHRGFGAIYIQAKYECGLKVLKQARRLGIEILFSHGTADLLRRHFAILEGFNGDSVDVFDPTEGRLHSLSRDNLREMWGQCGGAGGGHYLL